ncbi:MAG: arginine repressor [Ruminococcaceae bacterium]|jgi:transcriptional regulator of arginine metabolism|nr:arginine repressor [Oscillospiraceae bacterium]
MKKKRHQVILELIEKNKITTQEELQDLLKMHGFDVTQATVSRDIKELMLVKRLNSKGEYSYSLPASEKNDENKLKSIFTQSVLNVDYAGNMVVVKCFAGMASAACSAIDSNSLGVSSIVGTIAGDDSFFILCRNDEAAKSINDSINSLLRND